MKFLILFMLLISCTDNNKSSQSSTEPVEPIAEEVITSNSLPELFWVNKYNIVNVENEFQSASSIYYEPISQKYYFATIHKTNRFIFNTNHTPTEKGLFSYEPCIGAKVENNNLVYYPLQDPLKYVGSSNLTNRLYIDSNSTQYIKTLILIDTSFYVDYDRQKKTVNGKLTPSLFTNTIKNTIRFILTDESNNIFVIGNLNPQNADPQNNYPNGTLFLMNNP